MDREERKKLLLDMKSEAEEYGEEWAFNNLDDLDFWRDISYRKFENILANDSDNFMVPKDYDAIYDNCGVDPEDFEDIFLDNEIFEWAVKSAYKFFCNYDQDKA